MAPLRDVEAALSNFQECSPEQGADLMESVWIVLDAAVPKFKSNTISPREYLDWMRAILFWHAHEVFQGRASLEKH
jgi:hypothetical protein